MRVVSIAVLISLLISTFARADELVGTWTYSNPAAGETITVVFNSDGTGKLDNEAIRYTRRENQLIVTLGGEQIVYAIQIAGDQLVASGGDLEGRLTFTRQTASGGNDVAGESPKADGGAPNPLDPTGNPPADQKATVEAGIVGIWTDGQGRIVFNADGSCDYVGQKVKYTYDGTTLAITGAGGRVTMQVKVEGDTFTATLENETQTLTRVKAGQAQPAAADANGAAGVYVYSEASVDPTNVMCITQYLTLYPDGTIGWFKTELGASRTQVSDCLERFASYRTNPDAKGRTYGQWQADGQGNVVLQWTIWNNLRCNGRLDPQTGQLVVEKMGILSEGATLTFERQK